MQSIVLIILDSVGRDFEVLVPFVRTKRYYSIG
jgi:hypothetical protein